MKTRTTGIIDLVCRHSVAETVECLEGLLRGNEIKIFMRIDHAAEARAAGLSMPPTVLLIFGNPRLGTPLMTRHPSLALDLPTKALIWESPDGRVWLSYNSPEFLQHRHGLAEPPLGPIIALLQTATESGVAPLRVRVAGSLSPSPAALRRGCHTRSSSRRSW